LVSIWLVMYKDQKEIYFTINLETVELFPKGVTKQMMISPEGFIQEYLDRSYIELLKVRDKLIVEIRYFEKHKSEPDELIIDPSPEVVYQCNLNYLSKICELISQKYNQEFVWGEVEDDEHYLLQIRDYLESKDSRYEGSLNLQLAARKGGKQYSMQDHIRAMVYSMLSNRTKWYRIEPHLSQIDDLFFNYDPAVLKSATGKYFADKLFDIKCGNISTKRQMNALTYNIQVFESIEKEYGSLDEFVTSKPAYEIVQDLSSKGSPYKLKTLGEALVWEYLRNVGIDGAKPDVHLSRFLSGNRMGKGNRSPASAKEVYSTVCDLSQETGLTMIEIDNYIWSYCADGYAEICTAEPHCRDCNIRQYCNYKK